MDKTIQGLTNLGNLTNDDFMVAWDSTEADENNRTKKISPDVMSKYVGVAGQNSAIITSNSKDVSITMAGKQANDGMILCLTFTQAITGQNTDTMTLSFNGEESKTIKVAKNGVLENFTPFNVGGTYTFLGAYTNILLQRDETDNCYLIVGNPQVYKTNDYTNFADGTTVYPKPVVDDKLSNKLTIAYQGVFNRSIELQLGGSGEQHTAYLLSMATHSGLRDNEISVYIIQIGYNGQDYIYQKLAHSRKINGEEITSYQLNFYRYGDGTLQLVSTGSVNVHYKLLKII